MSKPALAAAGLAIALSGAALLRGPSEPAPLGIEPAPATLPRCTMVDGDRIDVRDTDVVTGCWIALPRPFAACDVTDEHGAHLAFALAPDRIVIPSARFGMRLRFTCREGR